jgi:hypothetical protein
MRDFFDRILKYARQPWRVSVPFKRLGIFLGMLLIAGVSYYWAIRNVTAGQNLIISVIVIWIATAYYLLPRVHRFLSKFYLPDYFIGRARTVDGLLSDPVNLAVKGKKLELKKALENAGWQEADPITVRTSWQIIKSTIKKESYSKAPVSDLFIFGDRQELAYQKEVDGNPAKRHHVRFWRVPKSKYLPGGYKVDWVAAATYDDAVGFSRFTLQVTHSIDGDVDLERDFVVDTLKKANSKISAKEISHFFPKYSHRNGGGHKYFTDGSLTIVDMGGKK